MLKVIGAMRQHFCNGKELSKSTPFKNQSWLAPGVLNMVRGQRNKTLHRSLR